LAETFSLYPDFTRFLNLSYLSLNSRQECQHSQQFVQHLVSYLEHTNVLTHINLSGMGLTPEQLLVLSAALANAGQLQGIHISGEGLLGDEELLE
jgi:hypothetical protein